MSATPLTPGYHSNISMDKYIADPCPEPSLSTGTVATLYKGTPREAYAFHPRLGGRRSDDTARGDIGSAVHAALLGGKPILYAPDAFKDWKKDAAKEFRDGVRNDGGLPLLSHQRRIVELAADSARRVLEAYGPGKAEQTMLWHAFDVWQRGRSDWLTDDGAYDFDIKTVERIDRVQWVKSTVLDAGYDVQHTLRRIGHETLTGKTRQHVWLLVEIGEDSVSDAAAIGVSDDLFDVGTRKIKHAAKLLRQCLDSGVWPGYGTGMVWASAPSWAAWELESRGVA